MTRNAATYRRVAVGFGHLLRLLVWLVPFAVVTFGAVAAGVIERRCWRASEWIYDHANTASAERWMEAIRGR